MDRIEKIAKNEALFRDVNENVKDIADANYIVKNDEISFSCECGNSDCLAIITLSPQEYEEVRAHDARFFALPGHEKPEAERIIERRENYLIIEKIGKGKEIAKETAPDDRS